MIFVADNPRIAPRLADASSISISEEHAFTRVKTETLPSETKFRFKQRYFSPDRGSTVISLYQFPDLVLNSASFSYEVEGWNIVVPVSQVADIPRQICRRFLLLWGKAERRTLSERESVAWLNILDRVDFREFSIQRAEPRVWEGLLLRKQPYYHVEWADGERTRLDSDVGAVLDIVEPGELFTARVKLGREERIVSISHAIPLGDKDALLQESSDVWR